MPFFVMKTILADRIYVGTVLRKDGTPAQTPHDYFATREAAVDFSHKIRRLGFRLTLKIARLHW
ncbi:hypothetical protein CCP3SC15_1390013 [Gammaproteobacteria bacterium]